MIAYEALGERLCNGYEFSLGVFLKRKKAKKAIKNHRKKYNLRKSDWYQFNSRIRIMDIRR